MIFEGVTSGAESYKRLRRRPKKRMECEATHWLRTPDSRTSPQRYTATKADEREMAATVTFENHDVVRLEFFWRLFSTLDSSMLEYILKAFDLLEQMRQNWDYEKIRAEAMEEELHHRIKEKDGLRKEIRIYREQLRDARSQIATLMSDKKSMEYDIAEWERKFELVNDLLKDQSHLSMEDRQKLFANGHLLNKKPAILRGTHLNFSRDSSDGENIDYDKTADTLDISSNEMEESRLRSGKVYRKQVASEAPCKRLKDESEAHITTVVATMNAECNKSPVAKITTPSSMNRSLSAANTVNKSEETLTLPTTPRCEISSVDLLVIYP
ncbi:unnamed protein product [Litomosoides sigmodontis]|uniref:Uncharacterized protein n=1 Tax=Litomosoides sigmodontis TaxID=42156 RepID=A0A3P6SR92_LITSI|nr:unnamed protein product [Litomosoides sigmodontis]